MAECPSTHHVPDFGRILSVALASEPLTGAQPALAWVLPNCSGMSDVVSSGYGFMTSFVPVAQFGRSAA